MIKLYLLLLLQGSLTFSQVQITQDCVWSSTPESSFTNTRLAFYKDLKAVPAAAPVFTQFRISIEGAGLPPSVQPTPAIGNERIVFAAVPTVTDVNYSVLLNEQSCMSWELQALVALVALNNPAVDAVLTNYKIKLVTTAGVPVFPR